jgi:alpha-1,3-glucan synthase
MHLHLYMVRSSVCLPCNWTTDIGQGIEKSSAPNGCLSEIRLDAWEYKAFVPKDKWQKPAPTITRVIPGHDARLPSTVVFGEQESVKIEIRFSSEMSCESVSDSLEIRSTTLDGRKARLNRSSIACTSGYADPPRYIGEVPSAWTFSAELENVSNGVHTYAVNNVTTADGQLFTNVSLLRSFFGM